MARGSCLHSLCGPGVTLANWSWLCLLRWRPVDAALWMQESDVHPPQPAGDAAKLDRFERRFVWFKSRLEERREIWGLFPLAWRVPQTLTLTFCKITKARAAGPVSGFPCRPLATARCLLHSLGEWLLLYRRPDTATAHLRRPR